MFTVGVPMESVESGAAFPLPFSLYVRDRFADDESASHSLLETFLPGNYHLRSIRLQEAYLATSVAFWGIARCEF